MYLHVSAISQCTAETSVENPCIYNSSRLPTMNENCSSASIAFVLRIDKNSKEEKTISIGVKASTYPFYFEEILIADSTHIVSI